LIVFSKLEYSYLDYQKQQDIIKSPKIEMRRIKELKDNMIRELCVIYPENESRQIVNLLIHSVTGWESKDIALDPDRIAGEFFEEKLEAGLGELLAHKPVQYVTGNAFFYGLELDVNPSVLIPRPETEELVKWICEDNLAVEGLRILDIGTGSGCILIALGVLLKNPALTGFDISRTALETASKNAEKCRIRADFRQVDILNETAWEGVGEYDIIVSNPPYVRESERERMSKNVLDYEPQDALFVTDKDPLIFYRAIAGFTRKNLAPGGWLYLEINENLGEEMVKLIESAGFREITIRKDMQGKERFIQCK
jgi:release factor glutamine methyltransferase